MQVETFNWQKNQPLAEDYIQQKERASALFDSHYKDPSAWEKRAAWLTGSDSRAPHADRKELVRILTNYNQRIGNSVSTLEAIAALEDSETLVVVGGQQAGLFTGQLMVIYKAITLLQLSRQWGEKLQRNVVPVFWIAGEDHDFDEANHLYYLSSQCSIEKLKVEHPTGRRNSVSRLTLSTEAWEKAIHELEASLVDTEFTTSLLNKLKSITAAEGSLTNTFARMMAMLFGEYGLVLIDSDDADLRRLEAPMFERLVNHNVELSQALIRGREQVERAGYLPQAEVRDDAAHLFIFEGEQRLLLHREGEIFTDKKQQYSYTAERLSGLIQDTPEKFSNNVMTRPLMQDYLFPVLATVLGPGEIAYWGLTKEAFHLFNMQMPVVVPRLEFTLMDSSVLKHMSKYDLTIEDVLYRFEDKKRAWLDDQDTLNLADQFGAVRENFRRSYLPLVESLESIHSGIKDLGTKNLAKIMDQIDYLETKAQDAYTISFESSLKQLDRIYVSLFPLAKPQERVYNICAYLNRYGEDWLKQLIETPWTVDGMHRVYYL